MHQLTAPQADYVILVLTLLGPRHLWGAVVLLTCPLVLPGATKSKILDPFIRQDGDKNKAGAHSKCPRQKLLCVSVYLYIFVSFCFQETRPALDFVPAVLH